MVSELLLPDLDRGPLILKVFDEPGFRIRVVGAHISAPTLRFIRADPSGFDIDTTDGTLTLGSNAGEPRYYGGRLLARSDIADQPTGPNIRGVKGWMSSQSSHTAASDFVPTPSGPQSTEFTQSRPGEPTRRPGEPVMTSDGTPQRFGFGLPMRPTELKPGRPTDLELVLPTDMDVAQINVRNIQYLGIFGVVPRQISLTLNPGQRAKVANSGRHHTEAELDLTGDATADLRGSFSDILVDIRNGSVNVVNFFDEAANVRGLISGEGRFRHVSPISPDCKVVREYPENLEVTSGPTRGL